MQWYRADLHIHSVLSPCGGLEMSPNNLVKIAQEKHLDILAVTDHNSCLNLKAYHQVLARNNIVLIPGVEIQTSEEIHLIALFNSINDAEHFGQILYDSLLPLDNDPDFFGDQVVVDADENIVDIVPKALINSSIWTFDEACEHLNNYDCLYYPAHVDATSFSLIGQLGFIPPYLNLKAVEITAKGDVDSIKASMPFIKDFAIIRSSDAHYLKKVGSGYTEFYLEEPSLSEIRKAINGSSNRKINIITEV